MEGEVEVAKDCAPGSRRLAIPDDEPLRPALLAALTKVLTYASYEVERSGEDHITAIHEFRKSLRRARALARLCRPFSAPGPAQRLATALKQAHRAASPLRDVDVLLATLEEHQLDDQGKTAMLCLRAELEGLQAERMQPERITITLARGMEECASAVVDFDQGLPKELSRGDLLVGLRRTYRSARRHYQRARRIADEVHVHNWRKRSKDVAYQLELFASGQAPLKELRREYSGLTSALGEITDLVLLRRHAQASEQLFGVPGHEELLARIGELVAARIQNAMNIGERLYHQRPRWFARSVAELAGDADESPVSLERV
jgi:CHAD domain-containing protein